MLCSLVENVDKSSGGWWQPSDKTYQINVICNHILGAEVRNSLAM